RRIDEIALFLFFKRKGLGESRELSDFFDHLARVIENYPFWEAKKLLWTGELDRNLFYCRKFLSSNRLRLEFKSKSHGELVQRIFACLSSSDWIHLEEFE